MVDDTDREILEVLAKNARTSNVELARYLRLSEAAVRKRIEKLQAEGVIRKFTIDYEEAGGVSGLVLVKVGAAHPVPDVCKRMRQIPGVKRAYEVTGDFDIVVFIHGSDIKSMNAVVDRMRAIPNVAYTDTRIVLKSWD